MHQKLEDKFNVIHPTNKNATYSSIMNYSDDLKKPLQRWYRYKEGFSIELVKQLIEDYNKNPIIKLFYRLYQVLKLQMLL
ncbi:hypothetical protein K8M07_03725 [Schnuerera sp. xch1]|uniref:hypothetical protein n=1 Tax=Schnuerera sp. xch1 TaxID=2874283 RepID=UPI001CBD1015|nr:hypothetical protein [Schnuerera sp. xch1]MBZ2174351.1 hypothetical protein [Schnuerera sp. xch1]